MKGIILAGGCGSRLYPITQTLSKQLLPVYDKPLIYYPLSTLLLTGIRDILVIVSPRDQRAFSDLLGDGHQWGVNLQYAIQQQPAGLAQAFIIAEPFIGKDSVCMILGDNIFYGQGFSKTLHRASKLDDGAIIFAYAVRDPERYGVIEFDSQHKALSIEEKPRRAKSPYAVTGLYFYDNQVISMAKSLTPSARDELEITDINCLYMQQQQLQVELLSRGFAWLDTGTPHSLLEAANFIAMTEARQSLKIGSPDEVAWRMGLIDEQQLRENAACSSKSGYGDYLINLLST